MKAGKKVAVKKEVSGDFFPKAEEVCKILAACKENGVYRLKCGPLEVDFAPAALLSDPQAPYGAAPTMAAEAPQSSLQATQNKIEAESLEEQGISTKERQLAEMLIEDPYRAEQMMIEEASDLEPVGDNDGSGFDGFDADDDGDGAEEGSR
jgi:hypothetical protein